MAAFFHSVVAFLAAISIISLTSFPLISATTDTKGSNILDLIHRDSPLSPLHNPLETSFDRLRKAFDRSQSRLNRFKHVSVHKEAPQSDIVPGDGEYYMWISVGNPPVQALAIADTGSDLTWVQCKPCQECYKQRGPIYDPRKSSTYHDVLCGTKFCNALHSYERSCRQGSKDTCRYTYGYVDGSYTNGKLGTEELTLIGSSPNGTASSTCLPNIVFGCGTNNGGTFDAIGSGLVGLGGGPLSLISQLGNETGRQFSYCLIPTSEESKNITSKIKFGRDNSVVSGHGAVSTPLVSENHETFYYVTLEAISVGNKRLPNTNSGDGSIEKGNIIIDSGTTLTYLDPELFDRLKAAVVEAVHAKRVKDPKGTLDVCFHVVNHVRLPAITAHFTGADVKLKPMNAFVKLEDGLRCLAMGPSEGFAIFGNLAQMNYEVGYDLDKRVVSFLAADCTKHQYLSG